MKVPTNAIAGELITLDASMTIDSSIDIEYMTIVWDVDCSVDSDGDGIVDNDADLVGSVVQYEFPRAGKFTVKAIAWDEEILKPSSKSTVIEVDSPDRTAFEEVMESLTGDEANPFIQLVMIAIVILGLVMFVKKGQRKRKSVWDDEDIPMMEAPMEAPGMDLFGSSDIFAEEVDQLLNSPQIPEDGLPPGWTEEQWQHYGHQYLEMQETSNEQNKE
jgi:hypothetical protein